MAPCKSRRHGRLMRGAWLGVLGCGLVGAMCWLLRGGHGEGDGGCREIHAQIVAGATVADCASPIGLCTDGTIDGDHGLRGETRYTAATSATFPGEPQTTLALTGTLEITTPKGSLATRDTFTYDSALGAFSAVERVVGGSGRFAGASGTLLLAGVIDVEGSFVSELSGTLCTD